MSKTAAILGAENERGQMVAQLILCSLAAVCTVGVIWAVGQRSGAEVRFRGTAGNPDNSAGDPSSAGAPAFTLPEVPAEPSLSPMGGPPAASGSVALPPVNPLLPQLPSASPSAIASSGTGRPALPEGRKLTNPQVIEAVEAARLARDTGDTGMALESLRSADLLEPQHPEILSEMALTHELMGRPDKAKPLWQMVQAMGESQAGGYYGLAKTKLEDSPLPLTAVASSPIQLGSCDVLREPLDNGGERVTVRVPILATPGAVIDPSQMDIHVFLFEQVNDGERIEQVRAEAPLQRWTTDPLDWTGPEGETLDIIYDLAAPTPEEMRNLGKRSFHGYIVKLFYQNKIVGEHSHPNTLQDFPPRQSPAGLDNALFPK